MIQLPGISPIAIERPLPEGMKTLVLTSLKSIRSDDRSELLEATTFAPGGSYMRRGPFFVDMEKATKPTQESLTQYFATLEQRHGASEMVSLPGALITGQGAVVTSADNLLKESVVEFTAHRLIPDGLSAGEEGTYNISSRIDSLVEGPCILVKRPWYLNFGHWLVDGASVLALAADIIQSEKMTVVIGDYGRGKMYNIVMNSIKQLVPGVTVLEHPDKEIWRFENLHYVTPPHVPPLFKLHKAILRIRTGFLDQTSKIAAFRKLFITRKNAGTRRVINEAQIFDICAKRGFEFIEIENYTMVEQARLFAQAKAIMSVKGAALTNCMFCSPNTKILVLSPADFPDPFFWDIAGQLGCDYGEVFGPVVTNRARGLNDFSIETTKVVAMLDAAEL